MCKIIILIIILLPFVLYGKSLELEIANVRVNKINISIDVVIINQSNQIIFAFIPREEDVNIGVIVQGA